MNQLLFYCEYRFFVCCKRLLKNQEYRTFEKSFVVKKGKEYRSWFCCKVLELLEHSRSNSSLFGLHRANCIVVAWFGWWRSPYTKPPTNSKNLSLGTFQKRKCWKIMLLVCFWFYAKCGQTCRKKGRFVWERRAVMTTNVAPRRLSATNWQCT